MLHKFRVGYNTNGSLYVDKFEKTHTFNANMILTREQLVQLQQSINFALKHYPLSENENSKQGEE